MSALGQKLTSDGSICSSAMCHERTFAIRPEITFFAMLIAVALGSDPGVAVDQRSPLFAASGSLKSSGTKPRCPRSHPR
jgi:hypothetical protein